MADTKITALPSTATLDPNDVFPVVTDVFGTPTNKRITQADLAASIVVPTTPGDHTVYGAGYGVVFTTPNGLHTYRVAIGNDGALTTEQLT